MYISPLVMALQNVGMRTTHIVFSFCLSALFLIQSRDSCPQSLLDLVRKRSLISFQLPAPDFRRELDDEDTMLKTLLRRRCPPSDGRTSWITASAFVPVGPKATDPSARTPDQDTIQSKTRECEGRTDVPSPANPKGPPSSVVVILQWLFTLHDLLKASTVHVGS